MSGMRYREILKWKLIGLGTVGFVLMAGATLINADVDKPQIINLTQTGCQFVEPEGSDHNFKTQSANDCKAINTKNGEKRLSGSQTLNLKPGKYIFRVTNKNVPYELGFYLRGSGLGRVYLPKVAGGGLVTGKTQDYPITLKEGSYVYSCPLNPTPDYKLEVKN